MSIVLRHKISGLYYQAPGRWVRRADNARVFESARAARCVSRSQHLQKAQAVPRLAPYLMQMLRRPQPDAWKIWNRSGWYAKQASKLGQNN
jgi:hypothetical protein